MGKNVNELADKNKDWLPDPRLNPYISELEQIINQKAAEINEQFDAVTLIWFNKDEKRFNVSIMSGEAKPLR